MIPPIYIFSYFSNYFITRWVNSKERSPIQFSRVKRNNKIMKSVKLVFTLIFPIFFFSFFFSIPLKYSIFYFYTFLRLAGGITKYVATLLSRKYWLRVAPCPASTSYSPPSESNVACVICTLLKKKKKKKNINNPGLEKMNWFANES